MSTLDPAQITTAEQLLRHSHAFDPCELVRGELILTTPAGASHGHIEGLLLARLRVHVEANGLGKVFSGDTGFILETSPDTVRSPDVAFVCSERVPPEPVEGFFPGPPIWPSKSARRMTGAPTFLRRSPNTWGREFRLCGT